MNKHDVFISYSTLDKPTADAVCHGLEAEGIRCWIAPRDVTPGEDWQQSLLDAIAAARAVVLVFTGNANESANVRKEVTAAFESGAVVIPFRLEEVEPQGSLRYHLTGVHWLDALSPPLEAHVKLLAGNLRRMLDRPEPQAAPVAPALQVAPPPPRTAPPVQPTRGAAPQRAFQAPATSGGGSSTPSWMLPALGGGIAVTVAALLVWAGSRGGDTPASGVNSAASLSASSSAGPNTATTPAVPPPVAPQPSPERLAAIGALRATPADAREIDNELQPVANGPPTSIRGGSIVTTQQLITTMADPQHLSQLTLVDALGCAEHVSIPTARCAGPTDDIVRLLRNANVEPDAPVIFFCHGPDCPYSYMQAQAAIAGGWSNVFWYRGGTRAWQSVGAPTASPAPLDPSVQPPVDSGPMETTN